MWPFRSKIPNVEQILTEESGELITIIHEKGAHKFRREEIIDLSLGYDLFSVNKHYISNQKKINWSTRIGHNLGALYFSFLLFGGFMNAFLPFFIVDFNTNGEFWVFCLMSAIISIPLTLISYILLCGIRKYIFSNLDNNDLSKDILRLKLNNNFIELRLNQEILWGLYNWNNKQQTQLEFIFDKTPVDHSNNETKKPINNYIFNLTVIICLIISGFYFHKLPFWFYSAVDVVAQNGDKNSMITAFSGITRSLFVPNDSLHFYDYYNTNWSFIEMYYHGVISNFILIAFLIAGIGVMVLVFALIFGFLYLYSLWPVSFYYSFFTEDHHRDIQRTKIHILEHLLTILFFASIICLNFFTYHSILATIIFSGMVILCYILQPLLNTKSILHGHRSLYFLLIILFCFIYIPTFFDFVSSIKPLLFRRVFIVLMLIPGILFSLHYLIGLNKLNSIDSVYYRFYKNYKPSVIRWLRSKPLLLKDLPKKLSNSYTMVQTALRVNPEAFEFASEEIKSDQEFIKEEIAFVKNKYRYKNWSEIVENDKKTIEILSEYLTV